ncbi:DNA translocase FtsK [Spiroplasma endosymbiont of Tipula paludosa]|uniref:DNA translocase FtsK n=1 Tax=Spiroplasma endosymbiont of Tipula paludosa TaxID=3066295 RepID=UPI0035C89B11
MNSDKISSDFVEFENNPRNTTKYEQEQQAKSKIIQLKKKIRRSDKIGGKIWALFIIFASILALARLTVIGQFLDDVLFNFLFGWFKYIIYFVILVVSFAIFGGIQIKIKKRVQVMIILLVLAICWFVNDIVLLISYHRSSINAEQNWFSQVISSYTDNWLQNSLFMQRLDIKKFFHINGSYFIPFAGGGFIGMLFSAVFGYLTTIVSLICSLVFLTTIILWILTGNPWYLYQWKVNKEHNSLHIVSFMAKKNVKNKKNAEKKYQQYFETVNVKNINGNDRQVLHTTKNSDITIKLPSVNLHHSLMNEDLLFDDIYSNKNYHHIDNWDSKLTPKINLNEKVIKEQEYHQQAFSRDDFGYDQTSLMELDVVRKDFAANSYLTPFNKEQPPIQKERIKSYPTSSSALDEVFSVIDQSDNQAKQAVVISDNLSPEFIEEINPLDNKVSSSIIPSNYFPSIINPNYQLPPVSLLTKPIISVNRDLNIKTAKNNVEKIHRLFKHFNIEARVTNINIGPAVTKFEIELGMGVKVSKITSLENDIKLALASKDIRLEAPIHGKSAVGIEIPNISPALVTIREVMENVPLNKKDSKLLMAIGKNVMGKILFAELDKMPHLLIAGATGSGKSICINSIIASLILRVKPHEVKFLLIDPKRVELSVYNNLPHLLVPVITDLRKANRALKQIISEMERRYIIFSNIGVRNIASYNQKVAIEEMLPYIVIIIDELADLMVVAGKEVEESIMRITQMARASGIHLIIATQRPSTDIITGVIKNNIPSRIAFAVSSSIDSRTILDSMGAEKLIGSGDMLFAPYGQITPTRAQGVYINDEDISALIKFISQQQKPQFNEQFHESTQRMNTSHIITGEDDELYDEICDFVIANKKASASLIQRRFGVGYNRAARLIDSLEANGIVGPQNGSKPREVLIMNKE